MRSSSRLLIGAIIVSIAVHGLLIFGVGEGRQTDRVESIPPVRIAAVTREEPPPPAPAPVETPDPPPEPAPEPEPTPDPPPAEVAAPEPAPEPADSRPEAAVEPAAEEAPRRPDPDELRRFQQAVRERIQAARAYPVVARRREQEGVVEVRFSLHRSGVLVGEPEVHSPARYRALNNAALDAVRHAAPFPPFPAGEQREQMQFVIAIRFSLID